MIGESESSSSSKSLSESEELDELSDLSSSGEEYVRSSCPSKIQASIEQLRSATASIRESDEKVKELMFFE